MNPLLEPPIGEVRAVVARALAEDLNPLGDVTSMLLDPERTATGRFVARGHGRIAGSTCAIETFRQVDERLRIAWSAPDGTTVEPGTFVGTVIGPLASMLTAERTALNLLGHLSGVATQAARYREVADAATAVWDTRKTTPGLRSLEKAAVRAGGCVNHRGNLSEWVMLKDNHLTGIGITAAVGRARATWPGKTVQVECDRADQAVEAVAAGADAVLLDNLDVDEAARCVQMVRDADPRCLIEISGGITLETIAPYSRIGADCISVGAITNSAPVLDIGLDITPTVEGLV
ncbi:MAG: carboxylating nicotinate-nucleotide diphosphorylase [Acidimicrobiia bacterium]|nr:carboxylating nicotinate-nucleotide diphosphorylase [Acidimicrobiia bacterium]